MEKASNFKLAVTRKMQIISRLISKHRLLKKRPKTIAYFLSLKEFYVLRYLFIKFKFDKLMELLGLDQLVMELLAFKQHFVVQ